MTSGQCDVKRKAEKWYHHSHLYGILCHFFWIDFRGATTVVLQERWFLLVFFSILIYSILLILFLLSTCPLVGKGRNSLGGDSVFRYFFLFICILLLGLRYDVGIDYLSYQELFYGGYARDLEILYRLLSGIIHRLGFPYWCMVVIVEFIKVLLAQRLIKRVFPDVDKRLFWFFYFSTSFLFLSLNIQRQALSVLFFLQGLSGIRERRFLAYSFWIALGSGFHYSVLILLPFYPLFFLYQRFPHHKHCLLFGVFILSFVFSDSFAGILQNLIFHIMKFTPYGHFGERIYSWKSSGSREFGMLVRSVIFSLVFLTRKELGRQYGVSFEILFFFCFIGNTLSNLFSDNRLLFRVYVPFTACNMILFSFLFAILRKGRGYFSKVIHYGGLFLLAAYLLGQVISSNNGCSPYQFVFWKF